MDKYIVAVKSNSDENKKYYLKGISNIEVVEDIFKASRYSRLLMAVRRAGTAMSWFNSLKKKGDTFDFNFDDAIIYKIEEENRFDGYHFIPFSLVTLGPVFGSVVSNLLNEEIKRQNQAYEDKKNKQNERRRKK